jgi:hypothetical protein
MRLEGEFARVVDARMSYRLDPDTKQILPNSEFEAMHGGDETIAPQSQQSANAGRPRRGQTHDRMDGNIPWST